MLIRNILTKVILFTLLPISIFSLQRFSLPRPIGGTAFWWGVQFLILVLYFIAAFMFFKKENKRSILAVHLLMLWNIISIVRGVFVAEIYWDWKGLIVNAFALLLPVIIYIVSDKRILQSLLSFYIKFVLPFSLLITITLPFGTWQLYLFPVVLLMLFFPVVKTHWKVVLTVLTLIGILEFSARSSIIKFSIPVLLLGLYYFRFFIATELIIKGARNVFMILPWFLFVLGVTGIFNVFDIKQYLKADYVAETTTTEGEVKKQNITDDSRTFMYREVLQSAQKNNYWWLGRSPARGNETKAFGEKMVEITGRRERLRNEANVPNIFTWTGIVGLAAFFFLFYKASALAINKSNNIYSKLIGLYVAFRWMYAWVEDPYLFDMNTFTIWIMIGICFSESFRKMSNLEVKLWARGIFDKRYIRYMEYIKEKFPKEYTRIKSASF